ncbi:carboxylesterase/lipase family protein [Deinococcus detaillensis]|nr:carboxylesterase/lipase family protein [Deinococcus detaillensis]
MKWKTAIFLSVSWLSTALAQTSTPVTADKVTVQTTQGAVIGTQGTVNTFLGLPYAAPPLGDLRWKPPQPPTSWIAPRSATTFSSQCPQAVIGLFALPGETPGEVRGNEDCLYLNVYAPKTATPQSHLPVMFWIHGGAFTAGSASTYDGSILAEKNDMVVVTVNYRLGALGFLSLPALSAESGGESGNYGLMDQQAALKWVRQNIAAFGGDPQRVTVAGESAGAMSICAQLTSPQAAGLFEGAILQSGLCTSPGNAVTLADAAQRNVRYASNLGCRADDLVCLRNVDPAKLALTKVPGLRPASNLVWSPVYASGLLPLTLQDAFAQGKFSRIPVMSGTNHDEGRLFVSVASPEGKPISPVLYWGAAGLTAGAGNAVNVLSKYPYRRYGTPALAFATLFTDAVFSCPALRVDDALSQYVPVYAFEFADPQAATTIKSPADLPGMGSAHSSSLVYAFQTSVPGLADSAQLSPAQRSLSDLFSSAWATFVKTGNPNPVGKTDWRAYSSERQNVQVFTPSSVQESTAFAAEHQCPFWLGLNLK